MHCLIWPDVGTVILSKSVNLCCPNFPTLYDIQKNCHRLEHLRCADMHSCYTTANIAIMNTLFFVYIKFLFLNMYFTSFLSMSFFVHLSLDPTMGWFFLHYWHYITPLNVIPCIFLTELLTELLLTNIIKSKHSGLNFVIILNHSIFFDTAIIGQ